MSIETESDLSLQELRASMDKVRMEAVEDVNPESQESMKSSLPLFCEIDADQTPAEVTEMESVCINCFKNGTTRLLLTKIPFYREVVLMSFKCAHCGFENNETQSASEIQEKGIKIVLKVIKMSDLNRRVVTSDYTSIQIPELELEMPAQSQKGEVTTVEGILEHTKRALDQDQVKRREDQPEVAKAIDKFLEKLSELLDFRKEFTMILEDVSGNSFIENPMAPTIDPNCIVTHFKRSKEQNHLLGLYDTNEIENHSTNDGNKNDKEHLVGEIDPQANNSKGAIANEKNKKSHLLKPIAEGSWPLEDLQGEVLQFQTLCSQCRSDCVTNMKVTDIPHFKEVIIMATVCDVCGCRTNEVKSGGAIEEQGVRFEVTINSKEDLTRDVLKSETCSLSIPELECEVGPSALGGRFTTVEGILTAMKEQLQDNNYMFHDSSDEKDKERLKSFLEKFRCVLELEKPATLILDDPAGNSYVQSLMDDDSADSKLKISKYQRSHEQNEELGLNDIKTENY